MIHSSHISRENEENNVNIIIENENENENSNNKIKTLNFLKVKNINLKEVINKINNDNSLVRIITNKYIEDDFEQDILESDQLYSFKKEYQNKIIKNISFKGNEIKKHINIEIINNNKNYNINITFIRITNIENSEKQQYTVSLDLSYKKICDFHCCQKSFCCIFICYAFCQKFCCQCCCQSQYEIQIENYLDEI
tara:strand:- start:970 stop:1554 length:585 start_codon:yes stop_codon:yes gene_type:complete